MKSHNRSLVRVAFTFLAVLALSPASQAQDADSEATAHARTTTGRAMVYQQMDRASLESLTPPDRLRAYRMADAVVIATDSKDARALDTLAAALARLGRMEEARRTNADAARLAAAQGDRELSAQITARGRQLKSR